MADLIVLGAGRVGAAMARDLGRDGEHTVTAADASVDALSSLQDAATRDGSMIRLAHADLSDPRDLARIVADHDLVIGAVPGPMGFETLRVVIEAGVDVVDISFFEEEATELDQLARERGVTAVVDAGVAPGLSNLILGHYESALEATHRFETLVGGLPARPAPPWEYKAPFSPIDVIAEYTRPARMRRSGQVLILPALSEVETVDLPGVGTLEAFNTDGLRTLLRNSTVPDLVEKTMRYPGHADRVRVLRDSGFFREDEVELSSGERIAPIELSARLLFDAWMYEPGEPDLTVMRVIVDGEDSDGPVRHQHYLLDHYDDASATSSMARTTGYTATAVARFLLEGRFHHPGIAPLEIVGRESDALEFVLARLAERGVEVSHEASRG